MTMHVHKITLWKIIVILSGLWTFGCCAKILAFLPIPAKSNHAVFRPILKRLAERGHDVTYYSPFPMDEQPKHLKLVSVSTITEMTANTTFIVNDAVRNDRSHWYKFQQFTDLSVEAVHRALLLPAAQELFQSNEKYDLLITGASLAPYGVLALAHKFNVTNVQIIAAADVMWALEDVGASENPSYMVNFLSSSSDQMPIDERIRNTYHWVINRLLYPILLRRHQTIMDNYMRYPEWETRDSIGKLASNTALYLVNSHFSAGYLFPKPSNHKEIGGVNVLPNKTLPKKIKQFLDAAVDGAIYFSMGTIVKTSDVTGSENMRNAFVNVFKKLKTRVLWKWEDDVFPDKPPNVIVSKWFPQQDILAHHNVKVFITQGGMASIFEAISRGVPLLGVPIFGDQNKNMKHASTYGYGIQLSINNLTEASAQWALEELLTNPSYKKEAERRALLFHDRPLPPVDEAVYWIEHVLKHGPVLRPTSAFLPFYKLYLLDILGIAFVASATIFAIVCKTAGILRRQCSQKIKHE